jgi:hypothetical protein
MRFLFLQSATAFGPPFTRLKGNETLCLIFSSFVVPFLLCSFISLFLHEYTRTNSSKEMRKQFMIYKF